MNLKTLLCLALAAALLLGCLTGCRGVEAPDDTKEPKATLSEAEAAVLLSAVTDAKDLGFSDFDDQLIEYLKQTGRAEENFTVSPLSFKAALTLAALGAEGETRDQLLRALGYEDLDGLRAWYAAVLEGADRFAKEMDGAECDGAYRVVNSVWSNQDMPGKFRSSFLQDVETACRAEADSARAAKLAGAVNDWVNRQTDGLIPSILEDASNTSAILVNALYLKTAWKNEFTELGDRDFTALSGETVRKPFMTQREQMLYYRDDQTQLISVPLWGGASMVFVLGDDTGLAEKLGKAQYRLVDAAVPMFEVETSLDQQELVNYLRLMGCGKMFSDLAEFDPMYTKPLRVDDILQKARVHIDEKGLEAAAATAVLMVPTSCEPDWEEPERFCADRPFSFYVVTGGKAPELLFWGQIVR